MIVNKNTLSIFSSAYCDNGDMPAGYGYSNQNYSIPLEWKNIPEGTRSFAISMLDENAPFWKHWLVINIPASISSIKEGASNSDKMPSGSKELLNTWGKIGYGGPQPPSGVHTYVITIYALNTAKIDLDIQAGNSQFLNTISRYLLGAGELSGKFSAP